MDQNITRNSVTDVNNSDSSNQNSEHTPKHIVVHHKKNLYPAVQHTFLVVCVLLAFVLILFLMHQNGKTLYENGL